MLESFEDGRLNILVEGTQPFRLLRRIEDLPYPAGNVEPLADEGETDEEALERARSRYADLVEEVTETRPEPEALAELDAYGMAATLEIGARGASRACWSCAPSAAASSSSTRSSPRRSSASGWPSGRRSARAATVTSRAERAAGPVPAFTPEGCDAAGLGAFPATGGTKIGTVDTGIDQTHPDLSG